MELIFIPLFAWAALGTYGWWSELREWNGGYCRDNGLRWVRFDTDSQGGRGYKAGDRYFWASWPVGDD